MVFTGGRIHSGVRQAGAVRPLLRLNRGLTAPLAWGCRFTYTGAP